jgi:hypothetical protein
MMRELADNLLDIAQNAVAAGASLLELTILVDHSVDRIEFVFTDNGKGMSPEFVKSVTDPFTTTRKTRRVGLGLPLLKQTAAMTGGDMQIRSQIGVGTQVRAWFGLSSIDRPPMGDVAGTLCALVALNPQMDFMIVYQVDGKRFEFDTRQIRQMVSPLGLDQPEIAQWIREYILQEINQLHGGAIFQ